MLYIYTATTSRFYTGSADAVPTITEADIARSLRRKIISTSMLGIVQSYCSIQQFHVVFLRLRDVSMNVIGTVTSFLCLQSLESAIL